MSIKSKIVSANLVVFGILVSALAIFVYGNTARSEIAAIDLRLESCAAKIITEFEDEWEEEKVPEWDDILNISVEGLRDIRMSFRTVGGRVLFTNDSIAPPQAEVLQSVMASQPVIKTVVRGEEEFRLAVFPVIVDNRVEFTLALMTPIEEIYARLSRLALILFASVVVSLLLASLAIYLVTRVSLEPMTQMVKTAEQISADKLDQRINLPERCDEVTRLGAALNDMMDRIETAFESQRRFVTDASHELRTPLTVIIGELEFIQASLEQNSLKENIRTVLGELDRLTRLVIQLLTLARIDAGKMILDKKPVRLDEVLIDCIQFMDKEARNRSIEMNINIEKALELYADPIRLKSVILNLLENAVRYNRHGGKVWVNLREISIGRAEITISDEGPGISDVDREKIFDRFYRSAMARAEGNGSGLGLAIVKEIVELHAGQVKVSANQGKGTSFTIELPINQPLQEDGSQLG